MTIKERLPIHKRSYPYFLLTLGLLFGLGIAVDWDLKLAGNWSWNWDLSFKTELETEKSIWDIGAAIGAMLGGFGTAYLVYFGLRAKDEWLNKTHEEKRLEQKIDLISGINEGAWKINTFITRQFIIDKDSFRYSDYMDIISKFRMQLDLYRVFDDAQESLCSDIENKLEIAIKVIGELHRNSDQKFFFRKYRNARQGVDDLVKATQVAHYEALKGLRTL